MALVGGKVYSKGIASVSTRIKAACSVSLALVTAIGCFPAPQQQSAQSPNSPPVAPLAPTALSDSSSAGEILAQLLKTYRSATTYRDEGVVKFEFSQGGRWSRQSWPCAVAFARPNKLSLAAFQATLKCDGREWKARLEDPQTNHLDGQVVVRPAPANIQLTDLAADQLLYDIISSQLRRQPIQLELLLESAGLAAAFGADVACQKLADGQTNGRTCFRVQVPTPGGPFVFWIDKQDSRLLRLDYPVESLLPDLASDPTAADLRLSVEMIGAQIGMPIDDSHFALEVPADGKPVRSFVVPPQPLPSQLFGQRPAAYQFTGLDGTKVDPSQFAGKIAVLVWYHDNPACEATLQQVSAARQRLTGDEAVAFYAIATDPTSASNKDLEDRLAGWKVELPIVRDLEAFGDKSFRIEVQPTLVVLDAQGRVQIFQPGGNPQLADQIVQIVERLKMGTDLAAEIVARADRERKQYDELVARGGPEPGQVIELPEAVIRQRSEPKKLQLEALWTCRDLKSPGNILVVDEPGREARILVVEGWRAIAELDAEGKIARRQALDLPERGAITYVRTATGKDKARYYAAAAPLAQQIYLFDQEFQLLRTFPASDDAPLAVTDLAFADVGEGDGTPEILTANVGGIGLVAAAADGKTAWRNRAQPNATSLAVSQPNDAGSWAIFASGDDGKIVRVNRFGHEEPPLAVGHWPIARLVAARFAGGTKTRFLGISNNERGELFAVGLTDDMQVAWNYPLPPGVHQRPIDAVASSNLLPGRQGEWWLAGPDGSIHVISEDGELHDSFHYGAALTGIAATRIGGRAVLLVATGEGVAAWKIE